MTRWRATIGSPLPRLLVKILAGKWSLGKILFLLAQVCLHCNGCSDLDTIELVITCLLCMVCQGFDITESEITQFASWTRRKHKYTKASLYFLCRFSLTPASKNEGERYKRQRLKTDKMTETLQTDRHPVKECFCWLQDQLLFFPCVKDVFHGSLHARRSLPWLNAQSNLRSKFIFAEQRTDDFVFLWMNRDGSREYNLRSMTCQRPKFFFHPFFIRIDWGEAPPTCLKVFPDLSLSKFHNTSCQQRHPTLFGAFYFGPQVLTDCHMPPVGQAGGLRVRLWFWQDCKKFYKQRHQGMPEQKGSKYRSFPAACENPQATDAHWSCRHWVTLQKRRGNRI